MAAAVLAAALAVTPIANDAPALFTPGRDTGAQPSAYVGRFYNPDDEAFSQVRRTARRPPPVLGHRRER